MSASQRSAPSDAQRRGLMFVMSSPSGAGKTTLCREILARDPALAMSVSVTTRAPRPGEIDGKDYHFRTPDAFRALRDSGGLLEWAEVHGNFYGTPAADVAERLSAGQDVLFDIDWQGAQQLAHRAAGDTVRVFILPPSALVLEQRLIGRKQDGPDVIERRLAGAAAEIAHWAEYDYVIVNARLDASLETLQVILAAERARPRRLLGVRALATDILSDLAARTGR